jgi:hypothetical protein
MWTSLAFIATLGLTPGQGALTLSNPRVTYGELGAVRPNNKFLPADIYFVAFDIDGITVDESGKVKYSMEMEVSNAKGQKIFKQDAIDREDFLPLGGTTLPARAFITIAPDQEPGDYVCKVKVTDRAAKGGSQTLEHKFEVLPKNFGVVQVYTTADREAKIPAPALGIAGQSVFVHFSMVSFMRDATKKQPNIEVEMIVYDAAGKATLPKPTGYTINNGVGENDAGIPLVFLLPMNRAGDFTVELKAVDTLGKQTSKVVLPIKVLPAAK